MAGVSAVIIARDEAARIAEAIRSVRPWVDEVLVLDGGSRDETAAVATAAGARVLAHPFDGFVPQKARASALAAHDFVFSLDADERVDTTLGVAIRRAVSSPAGPLAFQVRRRNWLDGRPLRFSGWWPDTRVRLFDRRAARWAGTEPHDRVEPLAPAARPPLLPGLLEHHPSRSLAAYRRSTRRHARRAARALAAAGARPSPLAPMLHALAHFLRKLLLRHAWLDGRRGLSVAVVGARGAALKYALARRLARRRACGSAA